MAFKKNELVLKENKPGTGARFVITYGGDTSQAEKKQTSYEILSLLKQERELLLEVNSSILNTPYPTTRAELVPNLASNLRNIGLDYQYQQRESTSSKSWLDLLRINRNTAEHRLVSLIPAAIWKQADFRDLLPIYGVRYYIFNDGIDTKQTMGDLFSNQISADQLTGIFRLVIFDCSNFGQMGINSQLTKEELETLIKK